MKSHVSMEQHVCPVCGATSDTGSILLDRRLKPTLERNTVTGYELCEEHKKLRDDGYVALIEAEPMTSLDTQPRRTGRYAHVRESVWSLLFDVPAPDGKIAFVERGVIDSLQRKDADPKQTDD